MNGEAKYYRDCVKHFLGTGKGDEPLGARERYGPLDHPTAEEIAASAHAELARAGLEVKPRRGYNEKRLRRAYERRGRRVDP
jgi:hypothetical protein